MSPVLKKNHTEEEHDCSCDRLVMCPPKYLSTAIKNNVWMKGEKVDRVRAMRQYERIKNVIEEFGVEVLEIPPERGCQDQTYVANIAVALDPFVVLANYKALGRDCEVGPAKAFYEKNGYTTVQPPYDFEGEADLKKLSEGLYFGGHGQFTDLRAHQWMENLTGVKIIPLKETNPKVYHLDCSLFVINPEAVIVSSAGLDKAALRTIEKHAEIIMVPDGLPEYTGCTNAVLIPGKEVVLSGTFNPELPEYREAMEWMNKTFDRFGYTCVFLDTDEADKSGADLSCMVMHLDFDGKESPRQKDYNKHNDYHDVTQTKRNAMVERSVES